MNFETLPACIDSSLVHDYISGNLNSIIDSRIYPLIIKGTHEGRDFYHSIYVSHSTIYHMSLHMKDTVFNLEVNDDAIRKDYSIYDDKGDLIQNLENVNAGWNTATALWKLMRLSEQQINQLEEKKQFIYKASK